MKSHGRRCATLFKRDPRCYWCLRITSLTAGPIEVSRATVDHVNVKPRRSSPIVLSCYGCNHARGDRTAAEFRLVIADRYYWATERSPDPLHPFAARSYLRQFQLYDALEFWDWIGRLDKRHFVYIHPKIKCLST